MSIPTVTTRLERTKQDMRKGRSTGSPVSIETHQFSVARTHVHSSKSSASTRMECRVHNLLGLPYFWRHLLDLARLVRGDGILRSLESLLAHKERPVRKKEEIPS